MTPVVARLDEKHPNKIVLESSYEHAPAIKELTARKWSVADKVWTVPLSWSSCIQLRATFGSDLIIGPDLNSWAAEYRREYIAPILKLRESVEINDDMQSLNAVTAEAVKLKEELGLFPHQSCGAAFMASTDGCGIFDETGTGKSAQTITALRAAHRAGEKNIFPALIVVPNSIKTTWKREWKRWWPELIVHTIEGGATQRRKALESPGHVYIINYEQMARHSRLASYGSMELKRCTSCGGLDEKITNAKCEVHERELNQIPFQTVVADECFTAGTKISTPAGDVDIKDVKAGDVIYGFDHETGKVVENIVESLYSRDATSVLSGVNATPNHPYFVEGEGYRPIGDIEADDKIITIMRGMQHPSVKLESGEILLRRMQDSGAKEVLGDPSGREAEHGGALSSAAYADLLSLLQRISTSSSKEDTASAKSTVLQLLEKTQVSIDVRSLWQELPVSVSESKILRSDLQEKLAKVRRVSEAAIRKDESSVARSGIELAASGNQQNDVKQPRAAAGRGSLVTQSWSERLEIVSQRAALDSSISDAERFCIAVLNCFDGIQSQDDGWRAVSELLHLGLSFSRRESSSRDRWLDSSSTQGVRPKTYGETRKDGLVGYPVLAVRNSQRYAEMSAEGERALKGETVKVYSMSTRHGNYFADDVLVRNCHRMLHPSKQTRAIWSVSDKAARRYALTGTPVQNDLNDFWFILRYIRPQDFPAKTRFIDRFADTSYSEWGILQINGLKPHREDEFRNITQILSRRMLKKVVLPFLPPIVYERRYVPLTPPQKKVYQQMLKEAFAQLDKGEDVEVITATTPLSVATRLLQFASSYGEIVEETAPAKTVAMIDDELVYKDESLSEDEPRVVERLKLSLPSNKISAFMSDIESGDFGESSIVVFAQSRQLIELLSNEMTRKKLPHGLITGAISTEERQQHIDDFQDGKTKFILVTIQAGGVGLTLTAADTMVFLQRSYSSTGMSQAKSRSHRIGSEIHETVTIIDYISEGTTEEKQLDALQGKDGRIEEILRDRELLKKFLNPKEDI